MRDSRQFRPRIVSLCVTLALLEFTAARAACEPSGTAGNDTIVCTGTDFEGVVADGGNDTIIVKDGALILMLVADGLQPKATAIDAGDDTDSVFNAGGIFTEVLGTSVLKGTKTTVDPQSTGIDGGEGNDTITNTGTVTAKATGIGVGFSGSLMYPEESGSTPSPKKIDISTTVDSKAAGIVTGAGTDTVISDGLLKVTTSGTSGGAADQILATVKEAVTVKSTSSAEASAAGIRTGKDSDTVSNDGIFLNTATATSSALSLGIVAPQGTAPPGPETPGAPSPPKKTQINTEANSTAKADAVGIDAEEDATVDSSEDTSPFGLDGLKITYERTVITASGDDTITNSGFLTNLATATSGAGSASISNEVDGTVQSSATSEATTDATGLAAGGGNDTVTNSGELLSAATATAGALSVSLVVGAPPSASPSPPAPSAPDSTASPPTPPTPPTPSADKDNKASSKTSVTATARATGIDAEGDGQSQTTTGSAEITDGALRIIYQKTVGSLEGNDTVTNLGAIQAIGTATAASMNAGVAISSGGATDSEANSSATSYSAAIYAGGGSDTITNAGILTSRSTATASAMTVGLAVGQPGTATTPPAADGDATPPAKPDSKLTTSSKTNVAAAAVAVGIDAEGQAITTTTDRIASISKSGGLSISIGKSEQQAAGNDTVSNTVALTSSAAATADSTDAAIQVDAVGSVDSESKAAAKAVSTGIGTGAGDDRITNDGLLTSAATADSSALSVALTVAKPPEQPADTPPPKKDKSNVKTDASVTAETSSTGIDAEGADHYKSLSSTVTISGSGLDATVTRSRSSLTGADNVINRGIVDVDATSTSGAKAAGIAIEAAGSVEADASSTARATSAGILTGGGDDSVDNAAALTSAASATATALAASVSVSQPTDSTGAKPGTLDKLKDVFASTHSVANATAEARSAGIDTEGTAHTQRDTVTVGISGDGLSVGYSKEVTSLAGTDTVSNSGILTSNATATAGAGAADVKVETEGTASSDATATAKAIDGAVLTGGGDDTVINSGLLSSTATATAGALAVSFSQADGPGAKSKSDARASSSAVSIGIGTDGDAVNSVMKGLLEINETGVGLELTQTATSDAGMDTVTNTGLVNSMAIATSGAAGAAITMDGSASTDVDAEARAQATGIATGGAADSIDNDGALFSTAIGTSGALGVSFGQKESADTKTKVKVDAKAVAEADASGISADGGHASSTVESHLSITADSLDFGFTSQKTAFSAVDEISNTGAATAIAASIAGAAGGAVAIDGAASADVTATAKSNAAGLDAGGGADVIENDGILLAASTSTSKALAVGFGQKTSGTATAKVKVKVDAAATAESRAVGISGDSGSTDVIDSSLSIDDAGLTATLLEQKDAASGNDTINNRGAILATATSDSGAKGVTIAIDGVAKADITATAKSDAAAINAGGGDDIITSDGMLTATASSTAMAVAAGIGEKTGTSGTARTKVEANTVSEAQAAGVATDGGLGNSVRSADLTIDDSGITVHYKQLTTAATGNDVLDNRDTVASSATATSKSASVALTVKGAAIAEAKSTATAESVALNTGAGADVISNSGELTADASATSKSVNASISTEGTAISNSGLLGGGNTANATAAGISSAGFTHLKSTEVTGFIDFNDIGVEARYETVTDNISDDGNDDITNSGAITVTSKARSPQASAGITGKGVAVSIGRASSGAYAGAIDAGNLDDTIHNTGELSATATSTAAMANVAATSKGLAVATNAVWDGGTKAEAVANGINADSGSKTTKVVTAKADLDVARVRYNEDFQAASGNDVVVNSGRIDASATARAPSLNVAVAVTGVAAAVSTASADAQSSAIRGGDGDDTLDNSASLTSTAKAVAASANVAVTNKGIAAAADAVWDGGTKADATAIGIAGDGGDRSRSTFLAVGTDQTTSESSSVLADGADIITNTGDIEARSKARALSAAVGVAVQGVAAATATATATSRATAIDAGAGSAVDSVTNSGKLTADATALGAAASVSVTNSGAAVSADSVWDGGTKADARARGIDVGAGAETITNDGDIDATASAKTRAAAVGVAVTGVAGASATATGKADAIAIDASAGNDADTVINNGKLLVEATSRAAAASVSVTNAGLAIAAGAVWDGGTGAQATGRGIDVGAGADSIANTGDITANASAKAAEAAAGVSVSGVAGAIATSSSASAATAIHAGDEDDASTDVVINSGTLVADARSRAVTAAVAVTTAGVAVAGGAVWDGGTTSTAVARGIETGAGEDGIDNSGSVTARSKAKAAELSAAVAVSGVAGAIATSTSDSEATAIHAGDSAARDTVFNTGILSAEARATAATAAVSVTTAGVAVAGGAVWDGGTSATAAARGIDVGEGEDEVDNRADINATSDSKAAELGVSVAVSGVAGAIATSTSESIAIAIDAGEGEDDDTVSNRGNLTADASALAATATVSVTTAGVAVAGDAVWDGGTTGDAKARGIQTGLGADSVDNSGNIEAFADAKSASAAVAVAVAGVAGASAKSTGLSDATAIDLGAGANADELVNTGHLTARADSLATAAAVTVTTAGVAVSEGAIFDGGTTADGRARGIDAGAGADKLRNEGNIDAIADVESASATVSVAVAGVAGSVGTSSAFADASGIDASAGDDHDEVFNSGTITTNADALAATATVTVTGGGVAVSSDSVWDGGTKAQTRARGIEVGRGADSIENEGLVDVTATTRAASASVAVAVGGVAGAIATSTAEADAAGLDSGEGAYDDTIVNRGDVTARSDATAASAAVSFTAAGAAVSGGSVWDGGTRAESRARGIGLGGGADVVDNDGELTSESSATATGISVSVAVEGVAGAITAATADSNAIGIDADTGDDTVTSRKKITTAASANANTVSVAATKFGVSVAGNGTWQGGTSGTATATGISGGAGLDTLDNSGDIDTRATVVAPSTAVSFTVGGVAASVSTATATTSASAIDGGDDADAIANTGELNVTADSHAVAVNVALTGVGAGVAADSVWDGGTTSRAAAGGIRGGMGNDTIRNTSAGGAINATANSKATSVSAAITVGGFAGSVSTSTAIADAAAIDAGAGDDHVFNDSKVVGKADARGTSVSISVVGTGGALASDSFWDGGTKATAAAAGIAGGEGNDALSNAGDVTADAASHTASVAIAASLSPSGGFAAAVAASTSTANATALDGGAGADTLMNETALTARADADAEGVSVSLAQFGAAISGAFVDAATRANATATGMAGADGRDTLTNGEGASIVLDASAATRDTAVALTLGGFAAAEANAISTAGGIGLDGGADDDTLVNHGSITGTIASRAVARGISIAGLGAGTAAANSTGRAEGAGFAGGAGDDLLVNLGSIDLTLDATAIGQALGGTLAGASISDASASAIVEAAGQRGDGGTDTLTNSGSIRIDAGAHTTARSISASALGVAITAANSTATAEAAGLAGGDADDVITNDATGEVDVLAKADVIAKSVAVTVAGAAKGEAQTTPEASAVGLDGGAGDDEVVNEGAIVVTAQSESASTSASTSVSGFSSSKAGTAVKATASGISGEDGEDLLINRGMLTSTAMSKGTVDSSSWTLAGKALDESALTTIARSTGMSGGQGADRIRNEGDVWVTLSSTLNATGGSDAIFGNAKSDTQIAAETDAIGLSGDAGADLIENANNVDVSSTASLISTKVSVSFAGSPSTDNLVVARARSTGIDGGNEADQIRNQGTITVKASSDSSVSGGAKTTFGGTDAAGVSTADAIARAVDTGAGGDLMVNSGSLTVSAASDATTSNTAKSGWIVGKADTVSAAKGTASSFGVSFAEGNNTFENTGDLNVVAKGTGYAFAYADGAHLSLWGGDGWARASSQAGASTVGILAGNGRNRIVNNKAITVRALATTVKSLTTTSEVCSETTQTKQECTTDPDTGETTCVDVLGDDGKPVLEVVADCRDEEIVLDTKPTYAAANGNGLSGDGNASSTAKSTAEAYGIKVGDGDNLIVNNQDISATASPEAKASVSASGGTTGDAKGIASASATAIAYGIWVGNGNNEIANNGTLTVTAAPKVQASADIAAGKGVCIHFLFWTWCIADGTGDGTAEAKFDSLAVGIHSGDGDNLITNSGSMTVRATPEADGAIVSVTDGIDHRTLATTVNSRAVGIQTGDGDNQIVNTGDGIIDVEATSGFSCSPEPCTTSATGIQTGNGNNLIVNDGVITTSVPSGSGSRADVAIQTGNGDDIVGLGDGSATLGRIELNGGDDSLMFIGSAKVAGLDDAPGSVNGGAGTDSLYFDGAGSFNGTLQLFENAAKDGAGTFALSSLPTVQQLQVRRGTLLTNSSYSFAPGGSFEAWIYGGGDHGMLLVNDGAASIDGNLTVSKGPGLYHDGATYDIIQASSGLSGDFDATSLPSPTPLLHFSLNTTADAFQVLAHAKSFTTVATNRVGMAVARHLDAITPTATGDLADVMGEIQNISDPKLFNPTLSSLSPEIYDGVTRAATAAVTAQTSQLLTRLDTLGASGQLSNRGASGFAPVRLAYGGDSQALASLFDGERKPSAKNGLWLEAFGQRGDQENDSDGYTGFDARTAGITLGYDREFSENWIAGAALGYSRVDLDFNEGRANGDISGRYLSLYGGWSNNGAYVQGVLSYGRNDYDQRRLINVGGIERIAVSSHDGDVLAASLSGGFMSQAGSWTRGPYATLHYARIDEEGFDESGAGGVNLLVDSKNTSALTAELGVRASHSLKWRNGDLFTELNAGWSYDFGIDDRVITSRYAGAPGTSFTLPGQDAQRNGAIFGAGLSYVEKNGVTAALRYQGEIREGYRAHAVFGLLRIDF